jgi:hypothetical protein
MYWYEDRKVWQKKAAHLMAASKGNGGAGREREGGDKIYTSKVMSSVTHFFQLGPTFQ